VRWSLLAVALAACGSGDPTAPDATVVPDATAPDAFVPDTSDTLFQPDHVMEVAITMDAGDFDTLRHQTRNIPDTLEGASCFAQPFPNPFSTFEGDVTVDGVAYPNVSIKKKGFFGSGDGVPSFAKPGLKLDANHFTPGQRFGGPGGLDKLILDSEVQDPSMVRTCLGYEVFTAAGVPAPRCGFAHVTVNGEDLGLYVHVENIDAQFITRHYGGATGNLYKGILSDFRPDWQTTFNEEFGLAAGDLGAVTSAAALPDDQIVAAVSAKVDLPEYLTEWAVEGLLRHWDGYAGDNNNFFVYDQPSTGKFDFLPWGTDQVMQNGSNSPAPESVFGHSILSNRLFHIPAIEQQYIDKMHELLGGAWNETTLSGEIDRMQALLDPDGARGLGPQMDYVRNFVATRRSQIDTELAAGVPAMDPNLGGPWCYPVTGHVSGSLTTTYGTVNGDPWASGSGSLSLTWNGTTYSFTQYGATAGDDPNDATHTQLVLVANEPSGRVMAVVMTFLRERLVPGDTIAIDWSPTYGILIEYDNVANQWNQLGTLGIGHIDPSAGAVTPGAPVDVTVDADLL